MLSASETWNAEVVLSAGGVGARYADGRSDVDGADVAMIFRAAIPAPGRGIFPYDTHALFNASIFFGFGICGEVLRVLGRDSRGLAGSVSWWVLSSRRRRR